MDSKRQLTSQRWGGGGGGGNAVSSKCHEYLDHVQKGPEDTNVGALIGQQCFRPPSDHPGYANEGDVFNRVRVVGGNKYENPRRGERNARGIVFLYDRSCAASWR